MRFVVTLLIVAVIAGLGIRRFMQARDARELAVYLVLLALGTYISFAGMLGQDLPNPNNYLAMVFGPLGRALGMEVTWQ